VDGFTVIQFLYSSDKETIHVVKTFTLPVAFVVETFRVDFHVLVTELSNLVDHVPATISV